jgi:hypothetical protein
VNAFSLKNTIGDLMKIPGSVAPGQLSCLHGLRVCSILWVMLAHTYMIHASWPLVNYLSGSFEANHIQINVAKKCIGAIYSYIIYLR